MRTIEIPALARSLSVLAVQPPSAGDPQHDAHLLAYHRDGGNCVHLHGEGGEIHTRRDTGAWLKQHNLRDSVFLAAQVCHDGWDETAQQAIDRFCPDAVGQDVAIDLGLIDTNYLDFVYLDDRPELPLEPIVDALCREIASGRVRKFGVRNTTPDRLKAIDSRAKEISGEGVAAIVTTELSLFAPTQPLWPGYTPFDSALKQAVVELGLAVLAHAGDAPLGQCLFGDEEPAARLRPHWVERWQHPSNEVQARRIREIADVHKATTRAIQIAWLLHQRFSVLPIVSLSNWSSEIGTQYLRGTEIALTDQEMHYLSA